MGLVGTPALGVTQFSRHHPVVQFVKGPAGYPDADVVDLAPDDGVEPPDERVEGMSREGTSPSAQALSQPLD
jgi:hypothetical protein